MKYALPLDRVLGFTSRLVSTGASLHWLKPSQKAPASNDWSNAPKESLDTLRASHQENANIGIRLGEPSKTDLGHIYAIDLDVRDEAKVGDALDELRRLWPKVDSHPYVISGSGGSSRHFYFICDQLFRSRKLAASKTSTMVWDEAKQRDVKKNDWEIELLGTGKQTVIPPSIHPDTHEPYIWGREIEFDMLELGIGPVVSGDLVTSWGASAGPRGGVENTKRNISCKNNTLVFVDLLAETAPTWADLQHAPQWVAWREDERNGKPVKVPYNPSGRGKAKSNNPATWAPRAKAELAAERLLSDGQKGGVGMMLGAFSDNANFRLGGVDLDSCINPDTKRLEPWANEVIDRFASYAEISPSGSGVKVFFVYHESDYPYLQDAMDGKTRRQFSRGSHCEIALDTNRYYTVTGNLLEGMPEDPQIVSLDVALWLLTDAGPRFLGAPDNGGDSTAKHDKSRSGRAFRLAGECRRSGQDIDGFRAELCRDADLAEWSRDLRQVRRAWGNSDPAIEVSADDFDDLPELLDGYAMTEDGVALAFAAAHADRLRFCHSAGRWYVWTGSHWCKEESQLAFNWSREMCRQRSKAEPLSAAAKALAKAATASAVERFARADRAFATTALAWDSDPWLLGTPNGTVDLRTGQLRDARQAEMITKTTAATPVQLGSFDAARDCPRWLAFLDQSTGGDAAAIRFLQQWAGYSLTGDTREEALLFVHGPGGSGKSTAVNTLGALLRDYAVNVETETLTAAKHARHSTEIARLHGARMAYASETEAGHAWAENRIKQMTGGDVMTARFMRQDDFSFRPQLKLVIVGNNKPAFTNVDGAIKRRFNVMPFDRKPETPDQGLKAALEAEFPGILSWAILGCLDWLRHGLVRPAVMLETTQAYFEEQDTFAAWLDDCCDLGTSLADVTSSLYESWSYYARRNGDDPGSNKGAFPERLTQHGFRAIKNTAGIRGRGWKGLRITRSELDPFDDLPEGDS